MRASGSYLQFLQKPPQVKLQPDQKQIITRIVRELTTETNKQSDLEQVLKMPHIQNMFREEFNLSDKEIAGLETQIINQCREIVEHDGNHLNSLNGLKRKSLLTRNLNADDNKKAATYQNEEGLAQAGIIQPTKSQPLTMLQRKELERYESLEYFKFPVQPCVRSLYYLSKIAQNQSIRIIIPPTVLIGFGDDNRIMYNDIHTGKLVVENKHISPKRIQNFIQSHIINGAEQQAYTIEDKLMYPKFVIKLAGKGSTKNEIKLYYSRESLIADLLSFWGSYDLALQLFVKQKHPFRPCIYRCYANKNGNIYKAVAVSNQDNYGKDSKFQKTLKQMIEDIHNKSQRVVHQRSDSSQKKIDNPSPNKQNSQMQKQLEGFFLKKIDRIGKARKSINIPQRNSGNLLQKSLIGGDLLKETAKEIEQELSQQKKLDSKGFPVNLEHFKLNDYNNEIQQCMPNSELKTAFTCTSDNIDNLTMMNCRPSALQQASLMTQDLFRLFSQYYLKIHKFGHINQFICDFMEDHNGLMYFLQVKSFECEGVLHEWQIPYNPAPKVSLSPEKIQEEKEEQQQELVRKCNAQIICRFPEIMKWLIQACTDLDIREGISKRVPEQIIQKYLIEVEVGKESFCLQSEKQRICSLYPLVTFCDYPKHSLFKMNSHDKVKLLQQSLVQTESITNEQITIQPISEQNSKTTSPIKQLEAEEQKEQEDSMVSVCPACFKIIEMFQARYYALVFKTEQTVDELRRLKLKLVNHWTFENVLFLVTVYKDSKKSLYVVNEIEKLEKRAFEQAVRERAKSPNSVMRKQIKNIRRPLSSYRAIDDGKTGITLTTSSRVMTACQNNRFEQMIAIDSVSHEKDLLTERTINKKPSIFSRNSERSKLKSSKSLLRSIDRFQKHIELIGGVPYDQSKIENISTLRSDKQHKPRFITIKEKPRPLSGVIQNEIISKRIFKQNCEQTNFQIQECDHQSQNLAKQQLKLNLDHLKNGSPPNENNQISENQMGSLSPLIVMNDTKILNNQETKNVSIFKKARELNTQPVSSIHQSSGHSTSQKIMQKNTGSKRIMNSLVVGSQKSDKDICDYFNQKRKLNINHPLSYMGLKDMQSISSFNERRQSGIHDPNQMNT